jgi:site-specific recombinase XerD
MELQPLKIRFYPKLKSGTEENYALYMRMILSGKRTEVCLNYELRRETWDFKEQGMKGKHPDKGYVINLTNQYRQKALLTYQQMIQRGIPCDVLTVRERVTGDSKNEIAFNPTILSLFDKFINRKKSLSGANNSKATIQKYGRTQAHVKGCLKEFYSVEDMACNKVDLQFVENFELYLKTTGKCEHNAAMKHMQLFKTNYKTALAHGWAEKDPFQKFKISMREVVRDYLSEKELQTLIDLKLPPNKLPNVRDLFVFCCFTGLAYIDLRNLAVKNIYKENGKYWIRTRRQKTNVKSNIPLLKVPLRLLKKYLPKFETSEPDKKIFRVISNQKMNAYLKDLADLCGIRKCLTFHIARHTFATTVTLNNGVPIESVSSMLGHKHITTTQHYAKLLDKKLGADMHALSQKIHY